MRQPPLWDCVRRGEEFARKNAALHIRHWPQDGAHVAEVSVNGGELVTRGAVPAAPPGFDPKQAERLATLIALEKMLALAQGKLARAVIPAPLETLVGIVYEVVHLHHLKMLGDTSAAATLKDAARQTPGVKKALLVLKALGWG